MADVTFITEPLLLALVKDMAIGIDDVETILKRLQITPEQFVEIARLPRFQALHNDAILAWQGADNAKGRVQLKTLTLIEEWLPEAHARLHDRTESLAAKVELAKALSKIAELGAPPKNDGGGGNGITLNITFGNSTQSFTKDITPQVIGAEPYAGN